jgi:hypothetical protein
MSVADTSIEKPAQRLALRAISVPMYENGIGPM